MLAIRYVRKCCHSSIAFVNLYDIATENKFTVSFKFLLEHSCFAMLMLVPGIGK